MSDIKETIIGNFKPKSPFARCFVPLLDALGWQGDNINIIEVLPEGAEHMDQGGFINSMANLHFECTIMNIQKANIDHRVMPCLFISEEGRVSIIISKEDGLYFFYDGTEGTYRAQKSPDVKGRALFFNRIAASDESLQNKQDDWFFKVVMRFKNLFLLAGLLSFFLNMLALVSPFLVMSLYNKIGSMTSVHIIIYLAAGIMLYIISSAGLKFLRSYIFNYISIRLGNLVSNEIFRRLLYLPSSYTETASLGAQIGRLKDFDTVKDFFSGPGLAALFDLPFIVILITGLFFIGGNVVLVPLLMIALFLVFAFSVKPVIKRISLKSSRSSTRRQENILEIITNLRNIKYTSSADYWIDNYKQLSSTSSYNSFKMANANSVISAVSHGFVAAAGISAMIAGVHNVITGVMTSGALLGSMMLVWRILAPLRSSFSIMTQATGLAKSIGQINRFMNLPIEKSTIKQIRTNKHLNGNILFNDVSLRYSSGTAPVLLGVNFSVREGETLVITGHNGSGMSSIFKLVLGLYHPQAGRIRIDGMNVKQINPIILRQSIGYSPQYATFFQGTIEDNLRLYNPVATEEEIAGILQKMSLEDEVLYYQNLTGRECNKVDRDQLTGSFLKRLSIAGLFLKDSSIMLLDEPENNLSLDQRKIVIDNLRRVQGYKTVLIISNNTDFLSIADKILWMDRGRVRMFGPKEQVLSKVAVRSET